MVDPLLSAAIAVANQGCHHAPGHTTVDSWFVLLGLLLAAGAILRWAKSRG